MIKFFRKIRQQILSDPSEGTGSIRAGNKLSKYLIYAIGEIVLVVIGILIALSINTWNEAKKQKKVEIKILKEVRTDLKSTLSEVKEDLQAHLYFLEKGNRFNQLLLSDVPYHDSIIIYFLQSRGAKQLYPKTGAYESLKSRGIEVITNDSIRLLLTDVHQTVLARVLNRGWSNPQSNIYSLLNPYIKKHFTITDSISDRYHIEGLSDSITSFYFRINS